MKGLGVSSFLLSICLGVAVSSNAVTAPLDKAMISFTFDDGHASTYTLAMPTLRRYGIAGTAYIVTDLVGSSWVVSWDQIWDLSSTKGWEIGNHTMSHQDMSVYSKDQVLAEVRGARDALQNHGVLNVTSLATPYGRWNEPMIGWLQNDGTLYSHRMSSNWGIPYNQADTFNQWLIFAQLMDEPDDWMTFSRVKPIIDATIANKGWLIVNFHKIISGTPTGGYEYSNAELAKIASYVYSKRSTIEAVTVTQGVAKMLHHNNVTAAKGLATSSATVSSAGMASPQLNAEYAPLVGQ